MVSYRKVGNKLVRTDKKGGNAPKTIMLPDNRSAKQKNKAITSGKEAANQYNISYDDGVNTFSTTKAGEGRLYTLKTSQGQTYQSSNLAFLQEKQRTQGGTIKNVISVGSQFATPSKPSTPAQLQGSYLPAGTSSGVSDRTLSQPLMVSEGLAQKMSSSPPVDVYKNEQGQIVSVGRPPEPQAAPTPTARDPNRYGGSTISMAPSDFKSRVQRSRTYAVAANLFEGFTFQGNAPEQTGGDRVLEGSRTTGQAAGLLTLGLSSTPRSAQTIVSGASRVNTALSTGPRVVQAGYELTKGLLTIGATSSATKKAVEVSRPSFSGITDDYFTRSYEESLAKSGQGGFGRSFSYGLTPLAGDERVFYTDFYNKMKEAGLSNNEAERASVRALQERATLGVSEGLSLVAIGASSERIGQRFVQPVIKNFKASAPVAKSVLAKKLFLPIAYAGAVEGATSVQSQSILRGEREYEIAGVKLSRGQAIAAGAGVGFFTAGTIGSKIGAGSIDNTGRGLNVAANIVDPTEAPGDAFARYASNIGARYTGRKPGEYALRFNAPTQTFTGVVTPTEVFATTTSSQNKPPRVFTRTTVNIRTPVSINTPTSVTSFTPVSTSVRVPTAAPLTTSVSPFVPSPSQTPTTTPNRGKARVPVVFSSTVPVPTETKTPVAISTAVTIPSTVPVPVYTTTTITTPTTVTVPVPVTVPTKPFIPLSTPGGSGGGYKFKSFFKGKQKKGYTPSTFAALTGLKGKRPSKLAISTGLSVRPIISNKKMRTFFG